MKFSKALKMFFEAVLTEKNIVKVKDGTEFIVDGELAEGAAVYIEQPVGESAEELEYVPVPDGEYELEDGRVLVVAEGKVAELREVPEPEAEPAEVKAEDEPVEAPADEPVEEPADELEPIKADIAELHASFDALMNDFAVLKEQVAALLESPAEESVFSKADKLAKPDTAKAIFKCK